MRSQFTAGWQQDQFSLLPGRLQEFFIFFFTAVAKQSSLSCLLTCETFVIFTDVPDTILSLFSPF